MKFDKVLAFYGKWAMGIPVFNFNEAFGTFNSPRLNGFHKFNDHGILSFLNLLLLVIVRFSYLFIPRCELTYSNVKINLELSPFSKAAAVFG